MGYGTTRVGHVSPQPLSPKSLTVTETKQTQNATSNDPIRSPDEPSNYGDPHRQVFDPSIWSEGDSDPDKHPLEETAISLNIPELDKTRELKDYSMEDLVKDKTLFKYGRKVYSNDLMQKIIRSRLDQFSKVTRIRHSRRIRHLVQLALRSWVSHEEMREILPVNQMGQFVDLAQDKFLSWIKQNLNLVLEDSFIDSENMSDYKHQLLRWLKNCPDVPVENKLADYRKDPNNLTFSIIDDDPAEFRKWLEDWKIFDTVIPESGAWKTYEFKPIYNPDLSQQFHDIYETMISRNDDSIGDFDMTIEGKAAWFIIERDIVNNDKATESQMKIWALRKRRAHFDDLDLMTKRRRKLADILIKRHKWEPDFLTHYMSFADRIDKAWQEFNDLCNKPFDPPEKYKKLYTATEN